MASVNEAESLGSGYYWVGSAAMADNLQCNPYLLVEGEEAVLFDPGSVLDAEEVAAKVASILPLENVKYVVLHHQDPDLAAAVPRLEALGMRFVIVTHWRTWSLVRFYGVKSRPYLVDEHGYSLKLATGRSLQFIPTPYLHFPGAIATYDKKAKFLLSSDLFGAFAPKWSLFAPADYMEGMKTFHEHYMPSNEIMRPTMELFSCLDLAAILPQHGSIINRDIRTYIEALKNLECGLELDSGSFREKTKPNYEELGQEVAKLREMNEQLMKASGEANEAQIRDAATGLYNENFFRNFIDEQASLRLDAEGVEDDVLAVLGIDEGMARIEYQYGPREVEAILKGIARIVLENKTPNQPVFRLYGTTFALWMPRLLFHEANDLCERIRKSVETSKSFIEPVTISIGLAAVAEIKSIIADPAEAGGSLTETGIRRLRLARKRGGNMICAVSEIGKEIESKAKVLVVDDDLINAGVVKTFLENADYAVATARDGGEALSKIGEEGFDLIISELMIPKVDGFMLKETLSRKSGTKDIPFILLSHRKNENSVKRAYGHGVDYYLQKPYLLAELLGIVQKLTKAGTGR